MLGGERETRHCCVAGRKVRMSVCGREGKRDNEREREGGREREKEREREGERETDGARLTCGGACNLEL